MEAADAAASGKGAAGKAESKGKAEQAPPREEPASDEDEGGISDDDLIASTAGVEQQQQQQQAGAGGAGPFQPPSVLGSMSLGLSRGAVMLQRAFHAAAVRAPPRRQLTRPQRAAQ